MPAWYLGALESSLSLGAIAGALTFSKAQARLKPHIFFGLSVVLSGGGILFLPWATNVILPLTLLFFVGAGRSWATIPIGTQISLTVPDAYRTRVGSIVSFMCNGVTPLGLAGAGYLISLLGLNRALVVIGAALILLTPLVYLIPLLNEFLAATPEEAETFLERHYPGSLSPPKKISPVDRSPLSPSRGQRR
jgi:hypothetical protein